MDANDLKAYFDGNFLKFYSKYIPNEIKKQGDYYITRCLFDKKKEETFTINNNGNYKCANCSSSAWKSFTHFYAKINGLDDRYDYYKIISGICKDFGIPFEKPKQKVEQSYSYTDEDGKEIFQSCRKGPAKEFVQRHLVDNKWVWNLEGIKRVLYNLPNVIKSQQIIIVEGEKDADVLNKLGYTATTNPCGAGNWSAEFNDYLIDKDVIFIPDNDTPGENHVTDIALQLEKKVKSMKRIELGLKRKGADVSDYFELGRSKEEFQKLIDDAPDYSPPRTYTPDELILTPKDLAGLAISAKRIFLFPWLTEKSINLLSGWRGTGKTWFALSILKAVSTGAAVGPWECREKVPVLLLDGEMPKEDIYDRCKMMGLDSINENFFIYSDDYMNEHGLPRANLGHESFRMAMERILKANGIKLWVVDNIASLTPGIDENKKDEWDPINQWLLELRFKGISTILIHHVNKEGGQRGTSAREDNVDVSIMLERPPGYDVEDGAAFVVNFFKNRVSGKHIHLLGQHEFRLLYGDNAVEWEVENQREQKIREAIELVAKGKSIRQAAKAVGISDTTLGYRIRNGNGDKDKIHYITEKDKEFENDFEEEAFDAQLDQKL